MRSGESNISTTKYADPQEFREALIRAANRPISGTVQFAQSVTRTESAKILTDRKGDAAEERAA